MSDSPEKKEKKVLEAMKENKQDNKQDREEQKSEHKKLQKNDNKQAKVDELTNDLKRVQAEFENFKKRCEKENADFRDYATAGLVKKLLSVLDSFEMALKNTDDHQEFVKGVELIYSQFYTILKEEGLQHIVTDGKKFDPYLHEVMLSEKSDKEDGLILEELQKGYRFKDRVLRHSKVKVAKNDGGSKK